MPDPTLESVVQHLDELEKATLLKANGLPL